MNNLKRTEIMTALTQMPQSNILASAVHTPDTTGYILIDSGLKELAAAVGEEVTTDSTDEADFLVLSLGGVEILQVVENPLDEDGDNRGGG